MRSIDQCLDLNDLRHYLADFYCPIGRPSIDPELMIRMLIVCSMPESAGLCAFGLLGNLIRVTAPR
ncbi:hypothetical protein ACQKQA_00810 [Pseudomonas sp. NPDC089530]|uniref:hypothetical protein n=1 Tax=Pseudomonas sp. NPDC089530 TaxID=3390651 RepID=UPI003CFC7FC8